MNNEMMKQTENWCRMLDPRRKNIDKMIMVFEGNKMVFVPDFDKIKSCVNRDLKQRRIKTKTRCIQMMIFGIDMEERIWEE